MAERIFDQSFLDTLPEETPAFVRGGITRLARIPSLAAFRDRLEEAVAQYPAEKRPHLISRIRSFSNIDSKSAISELLSYDSLRREYGTVLVEPALAEVEGKTPDFWVPGESLVVELATRFESPDVNRALIIEAINGIRSLTKITLLQIGDTPPGENPRISEIVEEMRPILEGYDGAMPLEPFFCRTRQGITLSGGLLRGKLEHPTVGGVISSYGFSAGQQGYIAAVRGNTLRPKVKKYRALVRKGIKFVLAIDCQNDDLDEDDFDEILFGDLEYLEDELGRPKLSRRNGLLRKGQSTSLSAILIRAAQFKPEWLLIRNQHTNVDLGDTAVSLCRAFGAREVRSPREIMEGESDCLSR